MGTVLLFPTSRLTAVEIFELPNGDWVAGVNPPMDGNGARRFGSHQLALLFAQGFAEGSGLQLRDWSRPEAGIA